LGRERTILKAIADGRIHANTANEWQRAWEKNPKATAALLGELEPVPALIDEAISDGRLAASTRDEWFAHWKEDAKATEAKIKNTPKGTRLAPGPTKAVLNALEGSGQPSDGLPDSWFRSPRSHTGAARTSEAASGVTGTRVKPPPPKAPPPAPAVKGQAAEPLDWPELKRANPSRRGRVAMDQNY
jgi:hypothetical protein